MAATISKGISLGTTEQVTNVKLHNLVDQATISGIVNAEISSSAAIDITKIAVSSQTQGDILYFDGTNWVRLAKGTAGQTLKMNAGATAPEWVT